LPAGARSSTRSTASMGDCGGISQATTRVSRTRSCRLPVPLIPPLPPPPRVPASSPVYVLMIEVGVGSRHLAAFWPGYVNRTPMVLAAAWLQSQSRRRRTETLLDFSSDHLEPESGGTQGRDTAAGRAGCRLA
jgi:hypothetical protein